jgi:hypothetical protein
MKASPINTHMKQFRSELYQSFAYRADAIMELIDALSSARAARSVVELSLAACFRRQYSSVYVAIDQFFQDQKAPRAAARRRQERSLLALIAAYLPAPEQQPYWLFGSDGTSAPRPFAQTLVDRGFVHQPNTLRGNLPVTIGHQYSILAYLPEKTQPEDPPWVVPLVTRRISTQEQESTVGAAHLAALLGDEKLPWHGKLCVHVGDTRYSTPAYLAQAAPYEQLVTIARFRGNRTVYRQPVPVTGKRPRGHPTWYGERFSLQEPQSWPEPDAAVQLSHITRRGRTITIHIQCWHDMLMRGTQAYPMHTCPFTLVRIRWLDEEGQPLFTHPLWVIVCGVRRAELSPDQVQQAYRQRSHLEQYNRFGKQRLLMTAYQTPEVQREENWWQIVQLAYVQLYLARELAEDLPRPWERYLPRPQGAVASPAAVQREFLRIIHQLGTPAKAPQPRGNSPGRAPGTRLRPRIRSPVVKKG